MSGLANFDVKAVLAARTLDSNRFRCTLNGKLEYRLAVAALAGDVSHRFAAPVLLLD